MIHHEDDYNETLKQPRAGITATERARELSAHALPIGPAETHARQETNREVAARLAALELFDPSQRRPIPKRSYCVDFIDL